MPLLLRLQMMLEESAQCPAPFQPADFPQGKLSSALSNTLRQLLRPCWLVQLLICSCWKKKSIISLIGN